MLLRKNFFKATIISALTLFALAIVINHKSFTSIYEALQFKSSAKILKLNNCSDTDYYLYDSIYTLTSLKYLEITECPKIIGLPKNLSQLNLTHFEFYWNGIGHETINYEPIGNISSLQHLVLGPYNSILELPISFINLKKLKTLTLTNTHIQSIPLWIDQLNSLEMINLSMCSFINKLPVNELNKLKRLKIIKLYDSALVSDSNYLDYLNSNLNCKLLY